MILFNRNYFLPVQFILFVFQYCTFCWTLPIDNGVAGQPTIGCLSDRIIVDIISRRSFDGRLFVKGKSDTNECFERYPLSPFNSHYTNASISVRFGSCNMQKVRSANPRGVFMKTTVIISFHPIFITKVDRAYHVQCFYQEMHKPVATNLNVSMLTTETIQTDYKIPECQYSIRIDSYDGPEAQFLRVGDPVYHRWDCSPKDNKESPFGMLVHSCFVDDGLGNKIVLLDKNGCGMDPYILGHPRYSKDLLMAYRETHVFKYADRNILQFACQIRLCIRKMGTCQGMTPPKCLPLQNRRKRDLSEMVVEGNGTAQIVDRSHQEDSFDLQTNRFVVFEAELLDHLTYIAPKNSITSGRNLTVCLSYLSMALITFCLSVAAIGSTVVCIFCAKSFTKSSNTSKEKVHSIRSKALQSFCDKRKQIQKIRAQGRRSRSMQPTSRSTNVTLSSMVSRRS